MTENLEQRNTLHEKSLRARANDKYVKGARQSACCFLTFYSAPPEEPTLVPGIPHALCSAEVHFTGYVHGSGSVGSGEVVDALTS